MNIVEFNNKTKQLTETIDYWIRKLDDYSLPQLKHKPDELSWSVGQLYLHLIYETNYYISEIQACLHCDTNENLEMTQAALEMFNNNSFPDIRIVGDSVLSAKIPQPENSESLIEALTNIKIAIQKCTYNVTTKSLLGKSKHPGLGYFSATNWIQFADMHFRHHEKQRIRIHFALNFDI